MSLDASGIKIRSATREDLPEIVRLLADDPLGGKRESYETSVLPPEYSAAFDEIKASASDKLVVAELDGEVVCTMHLSFIRYMTYRGGLRLQIEAVRVDERRRGDSLGETMLLWATSLASAREVATWCS